MANTGLWFLKQRETQKVNAIAVPGYLLKHFGSWWRKRKLLSWVSEQSLGRMRKINLWKYADRRGRSYLMAWSFTI